MQVPGRYIVAYRGTAACGRGSSLEGGTVHILSPAGEGALKADEKFKIDGASGLTGLRLSADGTKLYACDQGAGCVWILSTVEEAAAA